MFNSFSLPLFGSIRVKGKISAKPMLVGKCWLENDLNRFDSIPFTFEMFGDEPIGDKCDGSLFLKNEQSTTHNIIHRMSVKLLNI